MTVKLLDTEAVYQKLFDKLTHGWVLIAGDGDAIINLEYSVYTPGTPRNADFEVMVLGFRPLFMARKTPELRKLLKLEKEPDAFDSLLTMDLGLSDKVMTVESQHFNSGINREIYTEQFLLNLFKYLGIKVENDHR